MNTWYAKMIEAVSMPISTDGSMLTRHMMGPKVMVMRMNALPLAQPKKPRSNSCEAKEVEGVIIGSG